MDRETRFTLSRLADLLALIIVVIVATDLLLASVVVWGLVSYASGTAMCWTGVLASWLIACLVAVVARVLDKRRNDGR